MPNRKRRGAIRTTVWPALCIFGLMAPSALAADPILFARPDAFQTLVNPNCSHCIDEAKARAADLRADDPVLAWTRGKYEGGAIPIRFFLNPYRVISDTYGVFVYDPDAGFARGYEPSLDFRFHGWRNGIVVMRHKDGTLFSTLSGRAFEGPRKGEQLKPIATLRTNWGTWNKAYPGSVAYRMFEKYQPLELPEDNNAESKQTRGVVDPRLPEHVTVVGVSLDGKRKAYPIDAMPKAGGIIRDVLGDKEIVIFWQPTTRTAVAYSTSLDGADGSRVAKLEFDLAESDGPFVDRETNSRFDVEGRAVSGPLKGKTLTWVDSVQCRWFAWATEYPDTAIHEMAAAQSEKYSGKADDKPQASQRSEMVLVTPKAVTPEAIARWRRDRFTGIVLVLDEDHAAEAYRLAAGAIATAKLDLYYWIEIARNKPLADAHPSWMASLGMHDDWLARFPALKKPAKGEVAKAYPWVPIGYAEAFEAHLRRVEQLFEKVPKDYQGLLLNDLQGGPASCGCGNLRCRWALDYGVPATATKDRVDDAAARFVSAVVKYVPGKQVIPVWMTECDARDLPTDKAPDKQSTGLCGNVECATGTCPIAFAKQILPVLEVRPGPLGLLAAESTFAQDASRDRQSGWIAATVRYLDGVSIAPGKRGLAHDQLWLVVQGEGQQAGLDAAVRSVARSLGPAVVVVARTPLDQSYEPRIIAVQ